MRSTVPSRRRLVAYLAGNRREPPRARMVGRMTDTTTTPDTETLVATYFACGARPTPPSGPSSSARAFTEDGRHVDQHADATGHAGSSR